MRATPIVLAVLVLATACAAKPTPDLAALGQQILAAEAAEAAGWAARDVEKILNAYAPDAIVLLGGSPPMDRQSLRSLFVDFLADPQFSLTFVSEPPLVVDSGEVGITVGTYELTFTDPATKQMGRKTGKHLMNWKVQPDGQWRVIRQMTAHDR